MTKQSDTLLQPGHVIGGCRIDEFIASGGMGSVYRAHKELMEHTVAVKVLHPGHVKDPELLERFLREARLSVRLDHRHIVKVYDVGEQDGYYYIVMEFIEGKDLRALLKQDGPMKVRDALRVGRQVASALAYAHERGVVHRDVKPGNILRTASGDVKVADLGLARPIQEDSEVTKPGQVLGTPVFMSPEQCRGEAIDGRSDLYSLGASLYSLLSGELPFQADSPSSLLYKVMNTNPVPLKSLRTELPDKVVGLVQRMMAKHPIARFQTGHEITEAIDAISSGRSTITQLNPPTRSRVSDPDPFWLYLPWGRIAGLVMLGVALWLGTEFLTLQTKAESASQTAIASTTTKTDVRPARSRPRRRPRPPVPHRASTTEVEPEMRAVRARNPVLDERVTAFRETVVNGTFDEILEFFSSDSRSNQGLQLSLTSTLDNLKTDQLQPRNYFVREETTASARTMIMFRSADGKKSLILPLHWVNLDGTWYILPEERTESEE